MSCRALLYVIFAVSFATTAGNNPAHSADANEMEIRREENDLNSRLFAEESYYKLLNSGKTSTVLGRSSGSNKADFLPGEFYTFFRIHNFLNDDLIISRCDKSRDKWFVAVSMRVDYQGLKGTQPVVLVPDTPILVDGNNQDAARGVVARGCTFKSLNLKQSGPYLLYSGFGRGQGEYTLHFNVSTGSTADPLGLAMFTKLALAAGGALPGLVIPTGVSNATGQLSTTLDTVIDRANSFSLNAQYSAVLTATREPVADEVSVYHTYSPWRQVTGTYLKIGFPILDVSNEVAKTTESGSSKCDEKFFKNLSEKLGYAMQPADGACAGYIEVFQGRSASIVWDSSFSDEITADEILLNPGLGVPHNCIPGVGSCGKDASTFFKAGGVAVLLDIGADLTTSTGGTKEKPSGTDNWAKIFNTCAKMRQTAAELALSPIDALLVRWASLEKAGLLKTLESYAEWDKANPIMSGVQSNLNEPSNAPEGTRSKTKQNEYATAIREVKMAMSNEPFKLCWSLVDKNRMEALTILMDPKKFIP